MKSPHAADFIDTHLKIIPTNGISINMRTFLAYNFFIDDRAFISSDVRHV